MKYIIVIAALCALSATGRTHPVITAPLTGAELEANILRAADIPGQKADQSQVKRRRKVIKSIPPTMQVKPQFRTHLCALNAHGLWDCSFHLRTLTAGRPPTCKCIVKRSTGRASMRCECVQ